MRKIIKWLITILIIIILITIYARYIGTTGLVTNEYIINDKTIPDSFDGLKIIHFSDIHYNRAINLKKIDDLVKEINLIDPDIVVFTGDLIDKDVDLNNSDYDKLTTTLKKINAKYGKYAVIGNHDYYKDINKVKDVYEASNFKYLENSYDIIYSTNNEKIFIGGLSTSTYKEADLEKTFSYFKDNEYINYKIILTHEPDITTQIVKDYQVNLILAGHSHGGQIRLPIIGPLYTPPYAKKYYDSHYKISDTNLYISSGIGVSTINYRLNNPPSINFYRIFKEVSK